MKKHSKIGSLLAVVFLLIATGCATNRGIVSLQQPPPTVSSTLNGQQIFIKRVSDQREFQENPKTQDIPSLGFGGSASASEDVKKRAIARKRNGYGKAMGDILLKDGQTVETVINDALLRAFSGQGYTVLKNAAEVTPDTLIIDASIDKFWAYMTPGFWAIHLTCDISTTLQVASTTSGTNPPEIITVNEARGFQTASEGNWLEVLRQAVDKYVAQVGARYSGK